MSVKSFLLAKCGTAWRFLLFDSPDNGGWTYIRNGIEAKVQYVNIFWELNLSSSLTNDDIFLIKRSGLLTFISNSFFRTFIYLCIRYSLTFIIYVFHYFLWKDVRRTKNRQACCLLFDKEVFNPSLNTPDRL